MDDKQKIIIVGYPKSGNTWITRLTAELLNCPVKGFLYENNNKEISIEGLNRSSNYECFKSHHQYQELLKEDQHNAKIIYVVRDPRDIVLSGTNYFYNLNPVKVNHFKNVNFSFLVGLINRLFKALIGRRMMRKRMVNAVLNGDTRVHHWCRVSWKNHLHLYTIKPEVLKIKYEDALSNPVRESKKILDFIGEKRGVAEIEKAVELQSFNFVKKKFIKNGETHKATFLREGVSRQWKKGLNKSEKLLFIKSMAAEIDSLGYEK